MQCPTPSCNISKSYLFFKLEIVSFSIFYFFAILNIPLYFFCLFLNETPFKKYNTYFALILFYK